METVTVAVGSRNPIKIEAARRAMQRLWPQADFQGIDVPSGIAAQPMTDDEAILGARNRAERALAALTGATHGVGIEGNVAESAYGMFVTGWAVVIDQRGQLGIGAGGRFLLPAPLAEQVRQGVELGLLMDHFTGRANTKQQEGAVGILTGGALGRADALAVAVTMALTRFTVPELYVR